MCIDENGTFFQVLQNRLVVKYNIQMKYMTYSLLEFYNSIAGDVNPKFYDEKFARIMFTSFIGSDKVAKTFAFDPRNSTILLMKGHKNSSCLILKSYNSSHFRHIQSSGQRK